MLVLYVQLEGNLVRYPGARIDGDQSSCTGSRAEGIASMGATCAEGERETEGRLSEEYTAVLSTDVWRLW